MPQYSFTCPAGHSETHLVGMTADSEIPTRCKTCGAALKKDGAYLTSYEIDGNERDAATGELKAMTEVEKAWHRRHAADIDAAHAAGTLKSYKKGKKTPLDCQPKLEKALPNT